VSIKLCAPAIAILAAWHSFCAASGPYDPTKYGQYAPPDAFENGSSLSYYGSENEWSRRQFEASKIKVQPNRLGQRLMLAIQDGQPEQAAEWAKEYLAQDPQQLEALFALAVAQAQLGDVKEAFGTMVRAIDGGLPLERFVAGPRKLLEPLTSSKLFQDYLAAHPVSLIHGPMLGAMTDSSVRIWVRTADEADVTVRVFEHRDDASNAEPVATASGRTDKDMDYTGVVGVSGLKPDTEYSYDLLIDDKPALSGTRPSFRTYPRPGTPVRFRVAFGGGAGFVPKHERMWDTIASFRPAAVMLLGDNVYIDLAEEAGPLHRYTYYRRQSRPEFRRLVASTPVFAIWDDHDAAIDDVWLGPYRDKPSWKPSMLTLFKQNWNNPSYGSHDWPACWFAFSIGNVDFFMLDCRNYRTNPFGDKPTMLGPVQKAWLAEKLKASNAEFKVIVSSVAWAPSAKPGSRDSWDGFPAEREEILSWIEQNRLNGVVLVSADRHRSDARKIERPNGYSLYDFMSSRLTNVHTHELVAGALFGYNEKCSFGLLTFDTTLDDPQVTFTIVNIDGENIDSLTLDKSELSLPAKAASR
jgi:alkaline phosphatase D